jgi:5'-nucleotidase
MKKIVYVDMDNVLVDFSSAFPLLDQETLTAFDGRLDEVPNIFSLMKPMPDAIESFNRLSEEYDTYVLSTAPWENPSAWSDKLLWIKQYLGTSAYKRLILSHQKQLNHGDYLIDDRTKNGADRFVGEHIHFGTAVFPDWKTVMAYLLEN